MIKNLDNKIKKNFGIIGLVLLTIVTAISTTYFNYKKKLIMKDTIVLLITFILKKHFHIL